MHNTHSSKLLLLVQARTASVSLRAGLNKRMHNTVAACAEADVKRGIAMFARVIPFLLPVLVLPVLEGRL